MLETFIRRIKTNTATIVHTADSVALRAGLLGSESDDFRAVLADMPTGEGILIPRTAVHDGENESPKWSFDPLETKALRAALRYVLDQFGEKANFSVNTVYFDSEGSEIPGKVAKTLSKAYFQVGITKK